MSGNTSDRLLAGVIDSSRRVKGWQTSADTFDRDKMRRVVDDWLAWCAANLPSKTPPSAE